MACVSFTVLTQVAKGGKVADDQQESLDSVVILRVSTWFSGFLSQSRLQMRSTTLKSIPIIEWCTVASELVCNEMA